MGCSTCKGNNNGNGEGVETHNIDLIPKKMQNGDFSGNFILKLFAFVILIGAWPLISLGIFYIMFVNFFFPKKNGKKVIGDMFTGIFEKYALLKTKRFLKKREKEFEKNRSYKGDSELLDIEVFNVEENNKDGET